MYGKINEEIKCWIADLLPILNSGGAEFTGSAASIEEVEVKYDPRNFHHTKLGAVIVDGELHIIDSTPEDDELLSSEAMARLIALDFSGDEPDLSEA